MSCNVLGCTIGVSFVITNVSKREVENEQEFCERHGFEFLSAYSKSNLPSQVPFDSDRFTEYDISLIIHSQIDQFNGVFLRGKSDQRSFLIRTGVCEVSGLTHVLKSVEPNRPILTLALKNTVEGMGGRIENVQINQCDEQTGVFGAQYEFAWRAERIVIEMRATDAVVLAVVARVPILVLEKEIVKSFRASH
jgi:bifunctional DNase/RNase